MEKKFGFVRFVQRRWNIFFSVAKIFKFLFPFYEMISLSMHWNFFTKWDPPFAAETAGFSAPPTHKWDELLIGPAESAWKSVFYSPTGKSGPQLAFSEIQLHLCSLKVLKYFNNKFSDFIIIFLLKPSSNLKKNYIQKAQNITVSVKYKIHYNLKLT